MTPPAYNRQKEGNFIGYKRQKRKTTTTMANAETSHSENNKRIAKIK